MLKLDSETRGIPLVTCTVVGRTTKTPRTNAEPPDDVFSEPPAMAMN